MTVTIEKGRAVGTVAAPPSKSMAHRLLICAALSEGETVVHGIAESEDVRATLDCLTALGAAAVLHGKSVTVRGVDPRRVTAKGELCCRESGSTLRFFIPIALLGSGNTVLTGSETLLKRPMQVYEELCRTRGLFFSQDSRSVAVRGPLRGGEFTVAGNISSQFISGLLFALPLLHEDSVIHILPPVESRPYIDLTVSALAQFGVKVTWEDERTLAVAGNQSYAAREVTVEGDYSGAAFFAALNTLGGEVRIEGLFKDSLQGDRVYARHLDSLSRGTPVIPIEDCPDLGPVLFAVAAAKNGGVFTGTRRLKIKESDRAETMAQELAKFGVSVKIHEDSVVVYPCDFHAPREPLCGHNDHRVVMALAVLCTVTGGTIEGAQAVRKSFPDFFDKLKQLSIEVKTDET